MSSGVSVCSECDAHFQDLKMNKKYSWVVFRLSDDLKQIEVDCTGDPEKTYDDLVEVFKAAETKGECRYAVYFAKFDVKEGHREKICFLTWSPECAKIKQKMVYSSSKDALKKCLNGINKEIQTNDHDDLKWESIEQKLK